MVPGCVIVCVCVRMCMCIYIYIYIYIHCIFCPVKETEKER